MGEIHLKFSKNKNQGKKVMRSLPESVAMAAKLLLLCSATTCLVQGGSSIKLPTPQLVQDEPTSYFQEDSLVSIFNNRVSFEDYVAYSLRAMALVAGFDNDLHRYDRKWDLINSFSRNLSYADDLNGLRARIEPVEMELLADENELTLLNNERNQALCGVQLNFLLVKMRQLFANSNTFSSSKQLNLMNYLDSFGSPTAQLMGGNAMWLGSYEQCIRAKLSFVEAGQQSAAAPSVATRYCIGSFHSKHWPRKQSGVSAIKLGICLPQSCNTISYLRHREQIEQLVMLSKLNQVPYLDYELTDLYCLPDEGSPLRQFSISAKLFIIFMSSWFTLVLYFSIKYEILRIRKLQQTTDDRPEPPENMLEDDKCMRIFALRLSWRKLFEQPEAQRNSPVRTGSSRSADSQGGEDHLQSGSIDKLDSEAANCEQVQVSDKLTSNILSATAEQSNYKMNPIDPLRKTAVVNLMDNLAGRQTIKSSSVVDLSVMDGIKVISMIWLIGGHTLLYFIRTIANGRNFWAILKDARFMTVMGGIFPVDTFFTITGILTAYLKFKKNDGFAMNKTSYWIEAFVHRYLRFMPMYILVFWYTRDVSEFIGTGPLWDYGTANTSLRSVCKEESISVPLLFQANFKPIDEHCIKPAWYLANDYQFLLLTPIFMGLIMKSARMGYLLIGLSVFCSLIAQFMTVFFSDDVGDFGALINFKPMFATYVLKNLWRLYVLPYNRIPPYLIGIFTGHLMYCSGKTASSESRNKFGKNGATLSRGSQTSLASTASARERLDSTSDIIRDQTQVTTMDSFLKTFGSYVCIRVWKPLMLLISIIYLPMTTRILTYDGLNAKIGTSLIIALMRFTWSLAIARLIFICATKSLQNDSNSNDSFVIRLLSSPQWKPWSKIGLSVLLIQWEIISYLAQSQTSAPEMTMTFLLATILLCIFATYIMALLIYLTLEYPLSQVEQLYIHPILFRKRS